MESLKDLTTRVENILYSIGVPPHLSGFRYLTKAIEIQYYNQATPMINLYIDIANYEKQRDPLFNYKRVERSMRHAISYAFDCTAIGEEFRKIIFKDPYLLKCSNSFFIYTIVVYLKQEDRIPFAS